MGPSLDNGGWEGKLWQLFSCVVLYFMVLRIHSGNLTVCTCGRERRMRGGGEREGRGERERREGQGERGREGR